MQNDTHFYAIQVSILRNGNHSCLKDLFASRRFCTNSESKIRPSKS